MISFTLSVLAFCFCLWFGLMVASAVVGASLKVAELVNKVDPSKPNVVVDADNGWWRGGNND